MRKDYVEPDDYEYEPTPHDEVLEKRSNIIRRVLRPMAPKQSRPRTSGFFEARTHAATEPDLHQEPSPELQSGR